MIRRKIMEFYYFIQYKLLPNTKQEKIIDEEDYI